MEFEDEHLEDLHVHGGLSYGAMCYGRVCHKTTGGEDETWWLGFDCCYSGDLSPKLTSDPRCGSYINVEYVKGYTEGLAVQLHRLATKPNAQ